MRGLAEATVLTGFLFVGGNYWASSCCLEAWLLGGQALRRRTPAIGERAPIQELGKLARPPGMQC